MDNKYFITKETHTLEITDLDGEKQTVVYKDMTWVEHQQARTIASVFFPGGRRFEMAEYKMFCLEKRIISAPWGETTRLQLESLHPRIGEQLEPIIPPAFGGLVESDKKK